MRPFGSAYLVSPCSSAPFRWGRRSCLGLRTGVSPHFSMNSMREILAFRGGYERGRVPLPSPMPPESGAPRTTRTLRWSLSATLAALAQFLFSLSHYLSFPSVARTLLRISCRFSFPRSDLLFFTDRLRTAVLLTPLCSLPRY